MDQSIINLELRHLRYFLAIAEFGSFSRAAISLQISQPALSAQIKQLEKELGTKLFDRIGKKIAVTESGDLLLQYARRIRLELKEAGEAINELQELSRGKITVGVVQTVNAYLVPKIIPVYLGKYPGIFLEVLELSATEIETGVAEGKLALGISFMPAQLESIEDEFLYSEKMIVAVSKGHKLYGKNNISIEVLANEPLVTFPNGFFTRKLTDQMFETIGLKPFIVFETNTIEGILTTVRNSAMAAIVPELALRLKEGKDLHAVNIQKINAKRTLGLLWRRNASRKRAAIAFAEIVRNSF